MRYTHDPDEQEIRRHEELELAAIPLREVLGALCDVVDELRKMSPGFRVPDSVTALAAKVRGAAQRSAARRERGG